MVRGRNLPPSSACGHSVVPAPLFEQPPFSPIELSRHPCWASVDCKCEGLFLDALFFSLDLYVLMHFQCFLKLSGHLQPGSVTLLLCAFGQAVHRSPPVASSFSFRIMRNSPWGWWVLPEEKRQQHTGVLQTVPTPCGRARTQALYRPAFKDHILELDSLDSQPSTLL